MSWGQLRPFATNFAFLACWFRLTVCLFLLTVMAGWIQGVEYYSVHCITLRSLNRRDLRSMADRDRDRRERLKDGETWRLGDWWMESRWLSTHSSAPDAQSKNWAVVSQFSISLSLHSWVTPTPSYSLFALICLIGRPIVVFLLCYGLRVCADATIDLGSLGELKGSPDALDSPRRRVDKFT